jgi:hypothetical protein
MMTTTAAAMIDSVASQAGATSNGSYATLGIALGVVGVVVCTAIIVVAVCIARRRRSPATVRVVNEKTAYFAAEDSDAPAAEVPAQHVTSEYAAPPPNVVYGGMSSVASAVECES